MLRTGLATLASLAIPTAIALTLLAQLILVEASRAQFATHVTSNGSLAGLPVSAAVSFALLAQPILVFAGTPQFFALPTTSAAPVVYADAARSNLDGLRKGRDRHQNNGRRCRGHECKLASSLKHYYSSQLRPANPGTVQCSSGAIRS
jgi:hypothetical protein